MKRLSVVVIGMVLVSPLFAKDWREQCDGVASLAETIMNSRQEGISMSKMMNAIATNKGNDAIEAMIIDAYEQPRYNTESIKLRTIQEFRDKWYLLCVKELRP